MQQQITIQHKHNFKEKDNLIVCECGKNKLNLKSVNSDLRVGIKTDGKKYTVRKDRRRYFFPSEWNLFYKSLKKNKHKLLFYTALSTGARIMEILHLRPSDFDFQRGTVTFQVVKHREAKKRFHAMGRKRTFFVSQKYLKELKKYIDKYNVDSNDYLFLDNKKLPNNYEELTNKEKKKYFENQVSAYSQLFKRKLKSVGIKDYYNFSLHNIRKTYGNWIRIFNFEMGELCYRMGHDIETYLSHYGSSLIFTDLEKIEIMKIMGEVK